MGRPALQLGFFGALGFFGVVSAPSILSYRLYVIFIKPFLNLSHSSPTQYPNPARRAFPPLHHSLVARSYHAPSTIQPFRIEQWMVVATIDWCVLLAVYLYMSHLSSVMCFSLSFLFFILMQPPPSLLCVVARTLPSKIRAQLQLYLHLEEDKSNAHPWWHGTIIHGSTVVSVVL